MKKIIRELGSAAETLNHKQIANLVALISSDKFNKVVGFGAGRMGFAIRSFIMRLSHIGIDAYMIGDTNFPKIDENTLVLINSSSGNTETMLLYAKQAKEHGGHIVTITANKTGKLSMVSDLVVTYEVEKSSQIMKSVYEQFSFILFDHIAELIISSQSLDRAWISNNHSISE